MISGRLSKDKEFELENKELQDFVVERLSIKNGSSSIRHNGKKFECRIIYVNKNENKFTLKVNGQIITLELFYPVDKTIQKIGLKNKGLQKVNELRSPMPGLIIEIPVSKGEEVKKDQPLVILEAMKMENVLTSPVDGKIADVKVKTQQTVEKNNILITFES